ncbi:SDR family NAD(P)-dependent oxidoreductase [Sorangium sp. So ce590]|uniref:SDR family NAD(P)-dependent oxidoreductase n=1 Tax=unclassified Sorangium TaxID=2621164 RepID=UPI003F5E4E67
MIGLAVVTGPSRGIGRATALALARRGLAVALLGRPGPRLDETADEVRRLDVAALPIPCDVASEEQVARAAADVVARLGAPRVVVNNAGIVRRGARVHETSAAAWDEVMAVNLRGPYLVARAFLPAMLAEKRGRLVHVGSISSTLASPGNASYAASKSGLVSLSKSLAEELRGTGLQSIAVLPGSVDTDMLVGSGFPPQMSADDVARLIVYAALDAPEAVTGAAIEMFG